MEFPELGVHCSVSQCHQLDFLPVVCDACRSKFCNDHWTYDAHTCPLKHTKDVQVPVCPLCDRPVPTAKGTSPDASVSAHLDRDCREKQKRKTKNRCSVKKCKQTEFIKVSCERCGQNFCLKHRHPADHECQAPSQPTTAGPARRGGGAAASKAAQAALARQQAAASAGAGSSGPLRAAAASTTNRIANMFQQQQAAAAATRQPSSAISNGHLTEDEALARAMQASLSEQNNPTSQDGPIRAPTNQEEQDRMLAQALAESEREARRTNQQQNQDSANKTCEIS